MAEEKQAEATCVYTISGTEPHPVYGCPTLSQVLESLPPPNMVREEHRNQCNASNDVVLQCNLCFINTLITRRQKRMYTNTVALAVAVALIAGQMAALSQATSPPSNNDLSTEVLSPCMSQSHNHPRSSRKIPNTFPLRSGKANPPTQGADIAAASLATAVALAISSTASLRAPRPPIHIREPLPIPEYPEFSPNILWDPWDEYYDADTRFWGIYRALKYNTPLKPTFPDFRLKDGRLFYKSYCVVPEKLHIPVIQAWHGKSIINWHVECSDNFA